MIPIAFQRLQLFGLVCLLLAIPNSVLSQNKAAEKSLRRADANFSVRNYISAEQQYQTALQADPNIFRAKFRLGLINDYLENYSAAIDWYQRAVSQDPERNDTIYLYIGLDYKRLNDYRRAKEAFLEFQQRHQVQDEYYTRAQKEIEGCDLAEASARKRPRFRVKPTSFNSTALDAYPSLLDQRQEDKYIVFTSHRKYRGGKPDRSLGQPSKSDLFAVIMENDSIYTELDPLGKPVNTKRNDGTSTFTPDGLTMYYTICDSKKGNACNIYESVYDPQRKRWSKPVRVEGLLAFEEIVVNSRGKTKSVPTDDRQPSISKDNRTMYFSSSRPGGQGGYDIWFSRRQGSEWSPARNLGVPVNTPFDEYSPFINDDGTRIYFASEGHGGFGGFDLYYSEVDSEGNWGEPVNIGAPVNTSYDEIGSIWMDEDSLTLFSSNRDGGSGSYDVYWGRRIFYPLGSLNITVQGLIRDRRTKQPIPFATAILYEYLANGSIVALDTFYTDQTARYNFPLVRDKSYKILGNAPEYLANEEEVNTLGIEDDTDIEKNIDIELEPIVIGFPIVLQNIYYDFDEFYLRPDALLELNKLIKTLRQNDNITIQLGSHTDTNGTVQYNDVLSNNRARAAVKYLVDNGIDPSRLSWYGFGETTPLIFPELTDEDEQSNRRTEFRIMSIDFTANN